MTKPGLLGREAGRWPCTVGRKPSRLIRGSRLGAPDPWLTPWRLRAGLTKIRIVIKPGNPTLWQAFRADQV